MCVCVVGGRGRARGWFWGCRARPNRAAPRLAGRGDPCKPTWVPPLRATSWCKPTLRSCCSLLIVPLCCRRNGLQPHYAVRCQTPWFGWAPRRRPARAVPVPPAKTGQEPRLVGPRLSTARTPCRPSPSVPRRERLLYCGHSMQEGGPGPPFIRGPPPPSVSGLPHPRVLPQAQPSHLA